MKWYVLRQVYRMDCTAGIYIINNRVFCFTLEPPVQQAGETIRPGMAIPAGCYLARVLWSPKFGRNNVHIIDVPGRTEIEQHGGNTVKDTIGCTLVAFNRIDDCTIQGTAENELTAMLSSAPEEVFVEFVDTKPGYGV
jgi:hypothetical protein